MKKKKRSTRQKSEEVNIWIYMIRYTKVNGKPNK